MKEFFIIKDSDKDIIRGQYFSILCGLFPNER
jgi:hypothetical protein